MSARWKAVKVVVGRELASSFRGLGVFFGLSLSLVVSLLVAQSSLNTIRAAGVEVLSNPLDYPLYLATVVIGMYLAVCALMSVSREREEGTLEVLFYGPMDTTAFVLAKYVEQMIVFLFMLVFSVLFLVVLGVVSNLGLGIGFLARAVSAILFASCLISLGICFSAKGRTARSSVVLFLSVAFFFLIIDIATRILQGLPAEGLVPILVWVRSVVSLLRELVKWISPFAHLSWFAKSVEFGDGLEILAAVFIPWLYSAFFLYLAVVTMAKKGVRK